MSVYSSHGLDVFGEDAKVMKIDLEVTVSEVFDPEVFAIVFGVVAVWRDGVVVRRLGFRRSVGLRSAGVSLPCGRVEDKLRVGTKIVGVRHSSGRRGHNSPNEGRRSLEKGNTSTKAAQKSNHQSNCTVFHLPFSVKGGIYSPKSQLLPSQNPLTAP